VSAEIESVSLAHGLNGDMRTIDPTSSPKGGGSMAPPLRGLRRLASQYFGRARAKHVVLMLCVLSVSILSEAAYAQSCEGLQKLQIAGATITSASVEKAKQGTLSKSSGSKEPQDFCRVTATLVPSSDSSIRIEVWMPVSGWNRDFEGTGNGGFAGSINYDALAAGLRNGYAVANTDMGTAPSTSLNADVLIGHPQKWRDWGARATHEMTSVAKKIVTAYYNRGPQRAYFVGCSTGGEQGLMEAQRFPEDYDGIVAGAPANNRTRLHMDVLWNFSASERIAVGGFSQEKLSLVRDAVLHACVTEKTVPTDQFLSDPGSCHWDPQSLLCKAGNVADCLTSTEVAAIRHIYAGPVNPVTGASIYPGIPRGTEADWGGFVPKSGDAPYGSIFKWVFGAGWNWRDFDFNHDVGIMDERLAVSLNATDANLETFRRLGHKLIVYHGWADWLVAPDESIDYYEQVVRHQATGNESRNVKQTGQFYRLFMVPGMAHCAGGPGLNSFDPLPSLKRWVEAAEAPDQIVAHRTNGGTTLLSRAIRPYASRSTLADSFVRKNKSAGGGAEPAAQR
jgi:feruloyl esterase